MIKSFTQVCRDYVVDGDGVVMYVLHFDEDSPLVVSVPAFIIVRNGILKPHYILRQDVLAWVEDNFGKDNEFRYKWFSKARNLRFRCENDALLFKLTWCGG